ncbi:hypothetical protein AN480_09165 [Mycobacterium intracellulare subsp. chimaera]|nr:hypothetical protein AN480_09165 [Mycobacterium intracellulare subsp. chimaera]KPN45005.1 hypothetical protein AN933_29480 [Mycobacterium intracellulare subsp. chimaera]KPN46022.1 hypothetical protein AN932_24880 [Mycobacterium intracellulare subsp. chimaera]ORV19456.1 hypothetical protein AWB97_25545 [Mycobacterium intracellulare subsp. chimaera]
MGCAVAVGAGECAEEAATGPKVEFDAPFAVALAEVEAVPVYFAVPLFWSQAAMATYDDTLLDRQPGLQVRFSGFLLGPDPLALRRFPKRFDVVAPFLPSAAAILAGAGTGAGESVVVQVGFG